MTTDTFSMQRFYFEFTTIIVMSFVAFCITYKLLKSFYESFLIAGLKGADKNKINQPIIPEAQGVIAAAVYLSLMIIFIPIPFRNQMIDNFNLFNKSKSNNSDLFYENQAMLFKTQLIPYLAAILSICCMIFLGFADDVLNLRWRIKLILPTLSSLPLLMVHLANLETTRIIIPVPFRFIFGISVDIGLFYYVYMGMLAVFCTNAINIYAGINGLEAGQSLVIAVSVIFFNIIELNGDVWRMHLFSIYFLLPFVGVTTALLVLNWYPAELFVGDTFCYFAGMTFAVVGILGHFSKTLVLFFIPQVFNFLLSTPQLFHLIPCPRHRLPLFCPNSGLLSPSSVTLHPDSLSRLGRVCLFVCLRLRLTSSQPKMADGDCEKDVVDLDNLTLINIFLRWFGPMTEQRTTTYLLGLQILSSCVAFAIRYPIAWNFY